MTPIAGRYARLAADPTAAIFYAEHERLLRAAGFVLAGQR